MLPRGVNPAEAGLIIANGGIAAFPTETVYGLGGDATNPDAVSRIYSAKGRPGDNPLILHIANPGDFEKLANSPPQYAWDLINAFWPGPLTVVANKKPELLPWLGAHPSRTANTIGIRMPSHPMALEVIRASGCFVAAPSANKAGTPSPTKVEHVVTDFSDGSIDYVLDGGPVEVGVESTVVDVTGPVPVILRPGAVTSEMIAEVAGIPGQARDDGMSAPRAPGMKYRHYAPKAPMTLIVGNQTDIAEYISAKTTGQKIGILANINISGAICLPLGQTPEIIARNLYANLRHFDILEVDIIYAQAPAEDGLGLAIMDRMKKAAEGRVIHV
ncbi:MAG: L-threonylcarbamoyladenylate synthase [Defluviitaleaceae bacterium]|nr:L-threonylcarbamoyladenylate synthase [Defluviitaleaceae bacterium]